MHTFSTPRPVNLKVELRAGRVSVTAEETDTTTVTLEAIHGDAAAQELVDAAKVEQRGDEIIVVLPKPKGGLFRSRAEIAATITVPLDSNARAETGSADIESHGRLGNVKFDSGSGDVEIERGVEVGVRTGSGDITVRYATGSCDLKGGSSDITIGSVTGNATVATGSGDVVVDNVGADLRIKTGSGDVVVKTGGDLIDAMAGSGDLLVRRVDHGRVKVKTGSGDIKLGVAQGVAAYLDVMTVTGDVKSELDSADAPGESDSTVEISAQSGSGDVVLQRA